jgi:hypothetical protein
MRRKSTIIYAFILLVLTGCSSQIATTELPTLDATALNATAVTGATEAAVLTQSAITPSVTVEPSQTQIPTIDRTRAPLQSPTAEAPCLKAGAGTPIDVTIPDGTKMTPGKTFSKTWRLENVGTCTWTRLFTLVFFSGNSLNAIQTHNLLAEVEPGEMVDITVEMEAPSKPGVYQSNWMLSDPNGELFGIGPNGDAPFWVKIEVVTSTGSTPTVTATVTPTPVVFLEGDADLGDGDQLNLDSGTVNPGDASAADFVYQYGGDPTHLMVTMNGMEWMVYGATQPTFSDCTDVTLTGNAISFETVPAGTYLCYKTSDDLPGRLLIEGFEAGQLNLHFLTWSLP